MDPGRPSSDAPATSGRPHQPPGPQVRVALVRTKLIAPASVSGQRERARLSAMLDRGLEDAVRLTLLSAPPGYGKTVAVGGWLASRGLPQVWLSLSTRRTTISPGSFGTWWPH